MAAPADTGLGDGSTTNSLGAGGYVLARFFVRLLVCRRDVDRAHQEDARHRSGVATRVPYLPIQREFASHHLVGVEVLGHVVVVARGKLHGGVAVHGCPDWWIRLLERLGM